MLGRTHLCFGVATTTSLIGLTRIGIGTSDGFHHFAYHIADSAHVLSLPDLHPLAWAAIVGFAGLGSLLPDIDQPGSMVTRLPSSRSSTLRRSGSSIGRKPGGELVRLTMYGAEASGRLATAILGGYGGRLALPFRVLLWLLTVLAGTDAVLARWLPRGEALTWPVQARDATALACFAVAGAAGLVAAGGVAGLVNRLPGHHRGWTHAPPVALAFGAGSLLLGPVFAPALPGAGAALGFGYLSHLGADACTIRGIPLWWPGETQPSLHLLPRHLRVRTGSAGESLFNLCWPLALVVAIVLSGR